MRTMIVSAAALGLAALMSTAVSASVGQNANEFCKAFIADNPDVYKNLGECVREATAGAAKACQDLKDADAFPIELDTDGDGIIDLTINNQGQCVAFLRSLQN